MTTLKQFFKKNQNKLVKQIHDEIDSAQERLLASAYEILNNSSVEKINRLKKLGFTSVPDYKNYKYSSIEEVKLIEVYKTKYPFQKFLTVKELDRICKKYKLIYAPVSKYIKDVPEKNLKEIEGAKPLHYQDISNNMVLFFHTGEASGLDKAEKKEKRKGILIPEAQFRNSSNSHNLTTYFKKSVQSVYETLYSSAKILSREGLFIAAPKSHFNLKGLTLKGLGAFSFSIIQPQDPIVFRYCRGGVQVLSKWGLEASDEALINEIEN